MFRPESELEKNISDEVQMYAEKEYTSQLVTAMLSKANSSHISIAVDSMNLFESNIAFAHYMFQNPRRAMKLLDNAFLKVSLEISKTHILKADMVYKENLHVRLIALPNLPEVYRSSLPYCSDVGQFLCISGTVVKASTAKMLQYKKLWRCSKCKYEFLIEAEVEQGYIYEKPIVCSNPERCNGKNFTLMSTDINPEWCKDYQEIKLQEQVYNLNVGTVPRSMWVVLEDDLVETCYPGNDVIVSGILIQQWKPFVRGSPISIELVILAHNIEVQNKLSSGVISKDMVQEFREFWQNYKSDPLKGRNFILSSICPQVFGLFIVKLAVALVLAGGVQKKSGSSRIRGDSHLLLIGDPGTAKSQFLKFACKVSSRSVLTSGIGTTNAGLTVSAVKESGRWELEAGALVLADGGICCIDEFSCIKEHDKTCIHEAMEQQTISVAKAGLVCSLSTRCSILAATNPKGKYDENMSISENTALGTPLLSRFDIILVLLDTYDENWDEMVASYILHGRNVTNENQAALWPAAKMKNYFMLIRHINPKVTEDAERVLRCYYTKQRSLQSRSTSRTTPRLLQSLIRLAEGHARLMFRTEVLVTDAVIAIILVESSMLGNSILEGLSPLHTVFPTNPSAEYTENAAKVFENLSIDMPVEENYKCFYEESDLKNLLFEISAAWNSKDNPYLFQNPSCDSSSNTELYQESVSSINDITGVEHNSNVLEDTDDLFHKNPHTSAYGIRNRSPLQKIVSTEVHENDSSTQVVSKELNDRVSTLSDLRNIFFDNISEAGTFKSNKTENISVLHEILNEPDREGCNNIIPVGSNVNKFSPMKNDFHNAVVKASTSTSRKTSNNVETCIENKKEPYFVRSNTDILEELGISPEKKEESSQVNLPGTSAECTTSLPGESAPAYKDLLPKRSFAEQLKLFAFSKSRLNSEQNYDKKSTLQANENSKEVGTSSLPGAENSREQLKIDFCRKNDKAACPSTSKKSAFKMIVDKYKSSQSNKSESFSQKILSSEIVRNTQLSCSKNNQASDSTVKNASTSSEAKKVCDSFVTEKHSTESPFTVEEPRSFPEKKPASDRLKKFVFSKRGSSSESKRFVNDSGVK